MKIKRLLAVLICMVMVFSIPMSASAAIIHTQLTPAVHDHTALPDYPCRENLANMQNGAALVFAYDAVLTGFQNRTSYIVTQNSTHRVSYDEIRMVVNAVRNDHPECYWAPATYSIWGNSIVAMAIMVQYSIPADTDGTMAAALEAAVQRYLAGIDDTMPEYTREKIIHDRMVAHITYDDTTTNCANIYGALVEGKALCEGYARAFQYLLCRAGIQGYFVEGQAGGVNHAWNLVVIDDEYYYVDITWDDPADDHPEIEETRIVDYAYFNVTTAELERTHVIESPWVPECTATKNNFFSNRGHILEEFDIDIIAEHLGKHNGIARFYIMNDELYDSFWDSFEANFMEILEKSGLQFTAEYVSYGMSSVGYEVIPYIIGYEQNLLYGNIVAFDDGDATVTMTDADGNEYVTETEVSGHMGSFCMPNLPTGDYTLEVAIEGKYSHSQSISVGVNDYIESVEFDMPYRYGDVTGDTHLDLRDLLRLKLAAADENLEYSKISFNMLETQNFADKLVELVQLIMK